MSKAPRDGRPAVCAFLCALAVGCAGLGSQAGVPGGVTAGMAGSDSARVPAGPSANPQESARIAGIIRNAGGEPAPGVTVRAYPVGRSGGETGGASLGILESKTDGSGRFTVPDAPAGEYNVEAMQSDDFKAFKAAVQVGRTGLADVGTLVLEPTGTIAGRVTTRRNPPVTDFKGVDVYVPGTSYAAKTDETGNFSLLHVAPGTYDLAASKLGLGSAVARGVVVRPKETAQAPLLDLVAVPPEILRLIPSAGGPGAKIRIGGRYFGTAAGQTRLVIFSGAPATVVEAIDDQNLEAVVPPAALTGDVSLAVDGLPSNGFPFTVYASLSLGAQPSEVLLGRTVQYAATATDTRGGVITDPAVDWLVAEGSAVTVDGSGLARAVGLGDATVRVSSGTLTQAARLHVFRIDGVRLSTESLALSALPSTGATPAPGFRTEAPLVATVLATDRTDRAVIWESSAPELVTVQDGIVRTTRGLAKGTATVTARSADDQAVFATASVTVGIDGDLALEIF